MTSTTLTHTRRRRAKAAAPRSAAFTAALLESPKTAGCAAALKHRAVLALREEVGSHFKHICNLGLFSCITLKNP